MRTGPALIVSTLLVALIAGACSEEGSSHCILDSDCHSDLVCDNGWCSYPRSHPVWGMSCGEAVGLPNIVVTAVLPDEYSFDENDRLEIILTRAPCASEDLVIPTVDEHVVQYNRISYIEKSQDADGDGALDRILTSLVNPFQTNREAVIIIDGTDDFPQNSVAAKLINGQGGVKGWGSSTSYASGRRLASLISIRIQIMLAGN